MIEMVSLDVDKEDVGDWCMMGYVRSTPHGFMRYGWRGGRTNFNVDAVRAVGPSLPEAMIELRPVWPSEEALRRGTPLVIGDQCWSLRQPGRGSTRKSCAINVHGVDAAVSHVVMVEGVIWLNASVRRVADNSVVSTFEKKGRLMIDEHASKEETVLVGVVETLMLGPTLAPWWLRYLL